MSTPLPLAKIAESIGWMKAERNGVEVWRDPEGGHVVSLQLLGQMGESVPRAIAELREQSKIDSMIVGKLQAENAKLREDRDSWRRVAKTLQSELSTIRNQARQDREENRR